MSTLSYSPGEQTTKCSKCKSNKNNDAFGVNKLGSQYKCCQKCRNRDMINRDSKRTSQINFQYPGPSADQSWKQLFNAVGSNHSDLRDYLLFNGWTQVYDNSICV
jgi:hypothetical protein